MKQTILCTDMEGVLTPEIWEEIAKITNIPELMLTTKDIADYDKLMKHRLKFVNENGLTLSKIQEIIENIEPFPGVVEYLARAREKMQVIILSDTFEEFARPLIKKMNFPTIFCHNLIIENDKIIGYKLRIKDQKTKTVKKLKKLNFNTIAVGDSFNDTGMLTKADYGYFFKPGKKATKAFPKIEIANNYEELKAYIDRSLNQN